MKNIKILSIILTFGIIYSIFLFSHNVSGQIALNNNTKTKTNSLDFSEPIYQALSGEYLGTKQLFPKPNLVTEEYFLEEAIMDGIGNITNNMTFINTYLPNNIIQGKGEGTIETLAGQTIDWISSDLGTITEDGLFFNGIIHFANATGSQLLSLNNTSGFYKETPQIPRTIWLTN